MDAKSFHWPPLPGSLPHLWGKKKNESKIQEEFILIVSCTFASVYPLHLWPFIFHVLSSTGCLFTSVLFTIPPYSVFADNALCCVWLHVWKTGTITLGDITLWCLCGFTKSNSPIYFYISTVRRKQSDFQVAEVIFFKLLYYMIEHH